MKRLLAFAAVAALALTGCASQDPLEANKAQGGTVVVGSADFAESELLMEIYAEALRSTGTDVQTRPRIGAREFYVNAVKGGELTLVPEYTGNLLAYLDKQAAGTEAQEVYNQLKGKLPPELELLDQSPAEDSDVLAVTAATAATGVRSMTDLGPRCGEFVLGAPAEWKSRWEARIGEVYGCKFKEIRSVEAGTVTVDALTGNQVQVANLFTTSSQIQQNNLVKLDDPKNMFPAQNVVPLVHKSTLKPEQVAVLNKVSAALTTDELTDLNRQLEVDKANPADVAKSFVASAGI
ncbi:osmoprotectant transport system substrate-binding protein [Saccharopolyspora erythraea NRRL 2338]|uniref:ABC transport system substrate binding protein n=2 Tax=Saccharopolyspora erythraea TaxID=1836 RepID=A4FNF4_SACEN|nr:ABC transporter substrate-binding protein [Saccharopolyspora erythraea]EQD87127.1 ABC transporter substrate-binding protein [Saccharopolyspora erythraea D]PFG99217.1 osmoprotectant transport system substrate-binding protein [Saccharopolyspora erythraea NRRL 2338]QRK89165.1 ABC transporter substrate-binding protein [Saccharopolyspora erythraea]CAM05579.1 putative ABC transport system substrate binding protein [Saccharopolyspora erythraea NRRL 2338]